MGTQKQDLTMRDCKHRYSESDLARLIHAQTPSIVLCADLALVYTALIW